ncbi:MAG: methionyl-tRNA formyltransferase [Bacteroidia bacterium]|nr:methionyl-tRNA formyltransferase [Bacteroidia bacterium]
MKTLEIVYFGTPEFSSYILEDLIQKGASIKAVVTTPDKPAGRGLKLHESEVKKIAVKYGLPVLQPEKLKDEVFIQTLKKIQADIFIVIAFRMLPKAVWEIPPYGTYNIHASLLPKYRGAAPIQHALLNDEKVTGVTLFRINEEIDAGKILAQKELRIESTDNFGTLHDKLKIAGASLLHEQLQRLSGIGVNNIENLFITQNIKEVSYAPKIKREDLVLNWQDTAKKLWCRIRAFSPSPGAECLWIRKEDATNKIKILEARIYSGRIENLLPGQGMILEKKKFIIGCGKGQALEILEVLPEGKKKLKISDFLNGHPGITEWRFA